MEEGNGVDDENIDPGFLGAVLSVVGLEVADLLAKAEFMVLVILLSYLIFGFVGVGFAVFT